MPFQPVPEGYRVDFIYDFDGQKCRNVLAFDGPIVPAEASMTTFATELVAFWTVNIVPVIHEDVTLIQVDVTGLVTESDPFVQLPAAVTGGVLSSPALPNNIALCLKLGTGKKGRSNRGRLYHMGLAESQVTNSSVEASSANAMRDGWDALRAHPFTDPYVWSVLSRISGGVPRASGLLTPITVVSYVDLTVDSQRRRLPGRGS